MKMRISSIVVALLLFPLVAIAGDYVIDPSHTTVGFKVKHMTIANVSGWFEDFKGSFSIDERKLLKNVEVEIGVNSINTKIKKRDDHLRSADFFEVDKFPSMTFKSTAVEPQGANNYLVKGELTIKGITKPIGLDGQVYGPIKDPWGNERTAIVLNGRVDRKDFGLNWNKVIETGGLVVGDMVKIYLEGEGIRK